ncbi:MAG: phytoene desaturase [Phycisphaerae bacterium]|nr:phytoene desaturase [Phycisphaerae bacterium]
MIQTNDSPSKAVIVGGGLAGLACAVELATHGVRVTLVESNSHLGGKMNVHEAAGFVFDMGPTIITLPQVFRSIIQRAGKDPADYCELVDLDPQWRCFFEDGTTINLRRDPKAFAADLDKQFPGARPGDGYLKFIDWSRRMFRLSEKVFFYKDLGAIGDMMRQPPADPGLLGDVANMRMHATYADTIIKHIPEPHVQQVCEHFLQYVGSSPFLAPAILGLIASAQSDNGCWYPMGPGGTAPGGTRLIAQSLAKLAAELGVELVTSTRVDRIITDGKRATGVALESGRTIMADAVISNCDVQRTYRDLIGDDRARDAQKSIAKKYTPACSGLVLYLGLRGQYDHLAHHNFVFSADSREEFADIYHRGIPARDPTIYIAAPSRTDSGQAPMVDGEPGEALYLLIHTAYNRDPKRWEGENGILEDYRRVVLDKLKRFGMEDIEDRIVVEEALTPDGIDRRYNAEGGAIYGLASHGKLAGGFKPRNRSKTFRNLYLTGGSSNPGPGVPMVLMSGVTAARSVCEDFGIDISDDDVRAAEPAEMPRGSRVHVTIGAEHASPVA